MTKLVIISGMIRSGTTVMARILNAHNKIGIASDVLLPIMKIIRSVYLKKTHVKEYNEILDGYFDRPIDYIRMDNILDEKLESEIVDKIFLKLDKYLYMEPSLRCVFLKLDTSTFRSIITSIIKSISYLSNGKQILGIKEAYFDEFIHVLKIIEPDLVTIHVVRNPLDIYSSLLKERISYPLLYVLRFWRRHVDLALHNILLNPTKTLIIRYEDLVSSTENEISRITMLLKEKFSTDMLNPDNWKHLDGKKWNPNSSYNLKNDGLFKTSINKWKEYVKKDQILLAKKICAPELKIFYPEFFEIDDTFLEREIFIKAISIDESNKSKFPEWLPLRYVKQRCLDIWSQENIRYLSYYEKENTLSLDDMRKYYLSEKAYKYIVGYKSN